MKKPIKSFEIALSALACAVATGALTLGCYVNVFLAAGYLLAAFVLMVPLSKNFIWGNVLAFVASTLLTFLFCGFSFLKLVPYVAFFGLHPLANYLQKRFVKKKWLHALFIAIKAVWFVLALWLSWFVLKGILEFDKTTWYDTVIKYFYYILFFGGAVFFVVYDYMMFLCQKSVNYLVARIRR